MNKKQFVEKRTAARIIVLAAPRMTRKQLEGARIKTLEEFVVYQEFQVGTKLWRQALAQSRVLAMAFAGIDLPKSLTHVDRTLGWLGILRKCHSCHRLETPQRPLILYPEGGFRSSPNRPRKAERDKWFCDECGIVHCLRDTEEWPRGLPVVVFREAKGSSFLSFRVLAHWEWITLVKHFGNRVEVIQGRNREIVDAARVRRYPPR